MKLNVKGVGKKDLMSKLKSKINRSRPDKDNRMQFEVTRSSENILASVKYILSTGIKAFDEITGGIPFGRVTEIYGLDGCGKTGVAIRSAIRAQQRHIYEKVREPNSGKYGLKRIPEDADVVVLYIDNEHSLEEDDKTVLYDEYDPAAPGVKLDCLSADCDTVDQLFKIIDLCLDGIKAESDETGKEVFVIVIVDTIASTSSKEEMNAAWDKVDYARQPKQLREGFRKMTRRISRQNVAMICLNQVSDNYAAAQAGGKKIKYSTPQDEDFSTFGGRALKYYSSLRVFMFKVKGRFMLVPKSKFSDGYLIGFRTTKNRQIKPGREGRLALVFDKGYKDALSMMETMLFLGFCEMSDKGEIKVRFRINGINFKTETSLQDADDNDGRETDPKVECKGMWPSFYLGNKVQVDQLWDKAIASAFVDKKDDDVAANTTDILHDDDSDLVPVSIDEED